VAFAPIVRTLPKVELHLHLDISVSYRVASILVPGMTRETYRRTLRGPQRTADLSAFLATTAAQVALLQTPRALEVLTQDVISTLVAEGVLYAELRFAPLLHTEHGMAAEAAVEAVVGQVRRSCAELPINVGVILCSLRHHTRRESMQTARLVVRYAPDGVAAFDLGGDETGHGLAPHLDAFDHVRQAGLPFTVHAGEAGGPASVREVLALLDPPRIGHGVRSHEDPALVEELRDRGVHLEVCPSCNVQLGVFPSFAQHPVDVLRRVGIPLSVSTDSRTSTVTTLGHELQRCHETFGWDRRDLATISRMAADAAFTSTATRDHLHGAIADYERAD
jgi:adenosine deaminase